MTLINNAIFLLIYFVLIATQSCNERKGEGFASNDINTLPDNLHEDTSLLIVSADLLYKSNLYYEASIEYGNLIKADSANGKYLFRKAYCLLQIDSPLKAKEYYLKASKTKYKETECYYAIGGIYASLDNDSLGIVFLEKVLMIDPTMEKAKALLSDLKEESKKSVL